VTSSATVGQSTLPWLLLFLSVTTGMVDAISVLGLGTVFTANMTGNIVFMGFAAAGTPGFRFAPHLVAFAAFLVGAIAGGRVGKAQDGRPLRGFLLVAAAIEAGLLWAAAAIALNFDVASQTPGTSALAIIALCALAMGLRNATIRQLKVPDLTTTVLTMTITGLAADSRLAGGGGANWPRRLGSVAAIGLGAAIGAALVLRAGIVLPLVVVGGLILGGTMLWARHDRSAAPLGTG
jgi:uncharacterized membrane protein YoaK (UPF0700 family)